MSVPPAPFLGCQSHQHLFWDLSPHQHLFWDLSPHQHLFLGSRSPPVPFSGISVPTSTFFWDLSSYQHLFWDLSPTSTFSGISVSSYQHLFLGSQSLPAPFSGISVPTSTFFWDLSPYQHVFLGSQSPPAPFSGISVPTSTFFWDLSPHWYIFLHPGISDPVSTSLELQITQRDTSLTSQPRLPQVRSHTTVRSAGEASRRPPTWPRTSAPTSPRTCRSARCATCSSRPTRTSWPTPSCTPRDAACWSVSSATRNLSLRVN